jgi:hypothetical protein
MIPDYEGLRVSPFHDGDFWAKHNSDRSQNRITKAEDAGDPWCTVCGAKLNLDRAQRVRIVGGGALVLHPDDVAEYDSRPYDGGDMGEWLTGPECARLVPAAFRRAAL